MFEASPTLSCRFAGCSCRFVHRASTSKVWRLVCLVIHRKTLNASIFEFLWVMLLKTFWVHVETKITGIPSSSRKFKCSPIIGTLSHLQVWQEITFQEKHVIDMRAGSRLDAPCCARVKRCVFRVMWPTWSQLVQLKPGLIRIILIREWIACSQVRIHAPWSVPSLKIPIQ